MAKSTRPEGTEQSQDQALDAKADDPLATDATETPALPVEDTDPSPEAAETKSGPGIAGHGPADDTASTEPAQAASDETPPDEPPSAHMPDPSPVPEREIVRVEKQGGFLGMVLGGLVAAAAGYGVATYFPLNTATQDGEALALMQSAQKEQTDRLAALETRIARAEAMEPRLAAVESRPVEAPSTPVDLSPLQEAISRIEARLDAIEAMPADGGGGSSAAVAAALEAMRAEIDALKGQGETAASAMAAAAAEAEARLAEAQAQAEQLKAEAEQTARKALQAAALGRIQAAMESGAPFVSALADLGDADIPKPLADMAASGVPTTATLASRFPDAARAALDASRRATMGDSLTDRLSSFLQTATGSRSLAPREGSDPDAVLSRAEAAVRAGDLTSAMAEISGLPAEGQAALADWMALAQTRLDALSALDSLSAALSG